MAQRKPFRETENTLRDFALKFPGAVEEHPWDHIAIKAKGKMFLIFSADRTIGLTVTTKLPLSGECAGAAVRIADGIRTWQERLGVSRVRRKTKCQSIWYGASGSKKATQPSLRRNSSLNSTIRPRPTARRKRKRKA